MNHTFIIEHLEPELGEWSFIEYKHISKIVGKENLWFTNIKNIEDKKQLEKYGKVFEESVKTINLQSACILDPEADELLEPKDGNTLQYFIFGGILGDHPPRKRTSPELTKFLPNAKQKNIGKDQFSTDNAVYVVKTILEGKPFEKIPFQTGAEIEINEIESTDLPYKYVLIKNKPLMSKELIKYIKRDDKI